MLLDDNPDMLATTKLVLQSQGLEVETYRHAPDALEAQMRRPADVLITGIFMPDADGIEVIQQFRSRWHVGADTACASRSPRRTCCACSPA